MSRFLACLTVVLLLCISLFGPAFETVDHWDNFPQSGDDIVLSLICLVACVGAMLVVALLTVRVVSPAATGCSLLPTISETSLRAPSHGESASCHFPVLSLRI